VRVGRAHLRPARQAEIISVTVNTTRDYENARHYTYAEITIHGSVARADGSVGQYTVPAVVIYPRDGGNGVGVVDWLNCAFYHVFPPSTEFGTLQFTLLATGNHLFEEGYTYATVLWDKAVTEMFGPSAPNDGRVHNHLVFGSIDRSADAWEILLDTGGLLKNPGTSPRRGSRGDLQWWCGHCDRRPTGPPTQRHFDRRWIPYLRSSAVCQQLL
jgi:hypothetical protein